EKNFLFKVPLNSAPAIIYGQSPFLESIRIGEYIREHSNPGDTIAVLGSEPQIYFYAHRHSATGYIYTYGLLEPQKYAHQIQAEILGGLFSRNFSAHVHHISSRAIALAKTDRRWINITVCIFLAALAWIVFGQTLHHDFVNYDDPRYVYENIKITSGLSIAGI